MQPSDGFLEGTKLSNIYMNFSCFVQRYLHIKNKVNFVFVKRLCLTLLIKKTKKNRVDFL